MAVETNHALNEVRTRGAPRHWHRDAASRHTRAHHPAELPTAGVPDQYSGQDTRPVDGRPALATAGYGTALGVIRAAHAAGRTEHVFAGETRPWLQGARLTAWELVQSGIPVSLIADGAATWAMRQGRVRWVIVGADRVAANGDVANKIGTYSLAVSARHHGVRFMVVAPTSTIDPHCPSGADIPIESRGSDELLSHAGHRVAAPGAGAWNPVFDVTSADLVDALVTERGVVERPDRERIAALLAGRAD